MELKDIKAKKKIFDKAKKDLKKHFVGNDEVIDKVFSYMSAWYYTPEILTRPPIINLWGLTGVGKTDFVRRIVKALDFQDKFVEIDMQDTSKIKSRSGSMSNILSNNGNIQNGEVGILLLDEMQGFRTIADTGHEMNNRDKVPLQDVWTLLSDGKLPHEVEHDKLESTLWEMKKELIRRHNTSKKKSSELISILDQINNTDFAKSDKEFQSILNTLELEESKGGKLAKMFEDDIEEIDDEWNFSGNIYQIKAFKKMFRFHESLTEISEWPVADRLKKAEKRIEDPDLYGEDDYSKVLIFVSGNLDEAYGFCGNEADEVDIDPDVLFEMSKRINVIRIKKALSSRFRKEQIARLGNMHVIYPSINTKCYKKIIHLTVDKIKKTVKKNTGINLIVDTSIEELIYKNGVYPAQGTRPVFSTVSMILESNLPTFLMDAVLNDIKKIEMSYDFDSRSIVGKVGDSVQKIGFTGDLDILRFKKLNDRNGLINTAVHESGHAVAYSLLYKTVPCQIISSCIGTHSNGFVFPHDIHHSKKSIKDEIKILLAGRVAEEIVFGEENVGTGALSDYKKATSSAAHYYRRFGFGAFNSYVDSSEGEDGAVYNTNIEGTNNDIEKIISVCKTEVRTLLETNRDFFIEFFETLFDKSSLSPQEMHSLAKKYYKDIQVIDLDTTLIPCYYACYENYKSKQG